MKTSEDLVSGEDSLPVSWAGCLFPVSLCGRRGKGSFCSLFYKGTNSTDEGSTFMTKLSPKGPTTHWGLDFNIRVWRRLNHSVYCTAFSYFIFNLSCPRSQMYMYWTFKNHT